MSESLWSHQKQAIERARTLPHLALYMEPGTGKTATTIHILREEFNRRQGLARTLIFAPLSVCAQWKTEFQRFSKIPQDRILVLTGAGPKRVERLERAMQTEMPYIVVTNYEAVGIKAFYGTLLKWKPEICVADECHRLNDSSSKRARAIYLLTDECSRRFALTGTPVLNSLMDVFGQYRFLDKTHFGAGFWGFRGKYFYNKNAGKQFAFPDWTPHLFAQQEIGKVLSQTSVQAKRSECLDLPPLQQIEIPVEMSGPQAKAYQEMSKEFITVLGQSVMTAEFAMTKTLRMQQILGGFIQPDDEAKPQYFAEQPRLDALMEILESVGKEKVILWTTFRATYAQIGLALENAKIKHAFLTGEQSATQKVESLKQFKEGDTQVLVAHPAAASEGINLQEAKIAVYYLRGYNLGHFIQSQARNYRAGSERHESVIHYHLVCKGTLDEVIAQALLDKKSVGDAVLAWSQIHSGVRGEYTKKE